MSGGSADYSRYGAACGGPRPVPVRGLDGLGGGGQGEGKKRGFWEGEVPARPRGRSEVGWALRSGSAWCLGPSRF